MKYDKDGKKEWVDSIGGESYDYLYSLEEIENGLYSITTSFENSILVGNERIITKDRNNRMNIKFLRQVGVPEEPKIVVENQRKKFKIITEIEKIDGIKGGSISGEDDGIYEYVEYGRGSTKPITITPDDNYEIAEIIVNGISLEFEKETDGSYIMPQFENVTENKHIVVKFLMKNRIITINKVDSDTNERIEQSGIEFQVDQLDTREEPEIQNILGELKDNGKAYLNPDFENEIIGVLGELTSNGTYYFVEEDGKYVPTNSKTYQVANGETEGVQDSTAYSYIPIDLSNLEEQYVVVINAEASSESCDYGYATISESITAPYYDSASGSFVYVGGIESAQNYESMCLDGGKKYYLHLGYYKDSSVDEGEDQIIINSVKVYGIKNTYYNFIKTTDGKYESTNQGKDDTVSNSYMAIDLSTYKGKYNLTVNAEISSQDYYDYGYVTITENTDRPIYDNSTGRIVYISGSQEAKDYKTVLEGEKIYYLHMGYYKDDSISTEFDKFTINNISITLNSQELFHTRVKTNSEGKAITQIPYGRYAITEINEPDGYILNEMPRVVDFNEYEGAEHEFTIENDKICKLVVHHYIKGTTVTIADDEIMEGMQGEAYTTLPLVDLDKYELEKNEQGEEILPINANGEFAYEDTEVTYNYIPKKIDLTVHHYIEGTISGVPLKNGNVAENIISSGDENEEYETSAIANELLSDEYELAESPENANGIYQYPQVEVTYYYKKVQREVVINKYQEDGETALEGAIFNINETGEVNYIKVGEITNNGIYYFEKQNGKYVSNNRTGTATANSYIKIDLSKASKDSTVTVNAEKSGYGYAYATISESTSAPAYNVNNTTNNRFIYISAISSAAQNYTITLTAGKVYYLHLGYYKSNSSNYGTNTFTINSINVSGEEETKRDIKTTNEYGKITMNLDAGTYKVKEVEAPEGYVLDSSIREIIVNRDTGIAELDITNEKKTGTVIVHHYLEGTTTPVPLADGNVAIDETKTGYIGGRYATRSVENINKGYELVGIPENSSGEYNEEGIEVIYYYRTKLTSVLVHYYKEGTTERLIDDVIISGQVNERYSTLSATDIPEYYELVAQPENAEGEFAEEPQEVIYYYRLKKYPYTVNYIDKNTNEVISESKQGDSINYGENVDAEEEIIEITGYKYDSSNKDILTIGTEANENIINIYYVVDATQTKELSYTVEYYKDDVLQESDTQTETQEVQVLEADTLTVDKYNINISNKYDGYRFNGSDPNTIPDTVNSGDVIKVYYIKRTDLSYTIHYKEQGTNEELISDKVVQNQTYGETITENALDISGYSKVNPISTDIIIKTGVNEYTFYYTKGKFNYTVEYYYDNVKDDSKTETIEATYLDKITTYADKISTGYKLDKVEGTPLTISVNEEENIIKVYYKLDEEQTKDLSYTVEYYKNGTKVEADTESRTTTVQVLQPDTIELDRTLINNNNKYTGYKLESTDPEEVSDTLNNGTVIKVYYVTDGFQTKELSYTVEYYKDNSKVESDTQIETEVVQVLESDTLTVNKSNINTTNKYGGYVLDKTEPTIIPDTVNSGDVIKVYYIKRTDLSYTVHYKEQGTNEELASDKVVQNQMYGAIIGESAIEIDGYNKVAPETAEIEITTGTNEHTFYYTKGKYNYTVEYYYDNVKDNSKTETIEATYLDEITTYADKISTGYKLDKVEGTPLTISANEEENIIKVYYKLDEEQTKEISYTVEYYINDEIQNNDTDKVVQIVQVLKPDIVTVYKEGINIEDKYDGYKLEKIIINNNANPEEELPEKVNDGDTIKIYYVLDSEQTKELKYTVEYYKDDVLQEEDTQVERMVVQLLDGDTIEVKTEDINTEDKYEGYTFVRTEPSRIPLVAINGDVIKVYYEKTKYPYAIEYYYNGIKDNEATETGKLHKGEVVEEYTNKPKEGYEFEEVVGLPLTISDTEPNIIKVYYLPIRNLTVQHIDKNTGEILKTEEKQGKEGYTVTTSAEDIEGYMLLEKPETEEYTYKPEDQVVKYYYAKVSSGVIEKHIDLITGKPIVEDVFYEGYEGKAYTTSSKEIEGYKVSTNKEFYSSILKENPDFLTDLGLISLKQYFEETEIEATEDYIPMNAEGEMTEELITIRYYYTPKVRLIVQYVDVYTGEVISEVVDGSIVPSTINREGNIDEPYETEAKTFENYLEISNKSYYRQYLLNNPSILEEEGVSTVDEYLEKKNIDPKALYVPENSEGTFEIILNEDGTYSNEITVTYYYGLERDVVVKYYDQTTGEEISEETIKVGPDGDPYDVSDEEKEIEGYTLVEIPENPGGVYKENDEPRIFYYAKNTKVIVKYVDKDTGELIDTMENYTIEGYVGKEYETEKKDFELYDYHSSSNNTKG